MHDLENAKESMPVYKLTVFLNINNERKANIDKDKIIKEINDTLEDNETRDVCQLRGVRYFSCSKCGYGLEDMYLTNESDYPLDPVFCPNCGRKVVRNA